VKPKKLPTHLYVPDGVLDTYTREAHCTCGLPRGHPRHELPEQSADVHESESRRLGERSEVD